MSVRILPAGSVDVRRIDPPATPTVARIPAEVVEAEARARAIVAAARASAEAVRAEAAAQGLAEGRAEAAALLLSLRAQEAGRGARLTELVTMAAGVVAERLLGEALSADDAALLAWARHSLAVFSRARRVLLRVHPETEGRLRPRLDALLPGRDTVFELLPDPAIAPLALVVSADSGEARIELTVQIEALLRSLTPLLASEVRGG